MLIYTLFSLVDYSYYSLFFRDPLNLYMDMEIEQNVKNVLKTHLLITATWELAKWQTSVRNRHYSLVFLCLWSVFIVFTRHSNRAHSIYNAPTHVQLHHKIKTRDVTIAQYVDLISRTLGNLCKSNSRVRTEESLQIFEHTVKILLAAADFVSKIRHKDLNYSIIRVQILVSC